MPVCLPWKQSIKPSDSLGQFYVAGWGQSTHLVSDKGSLDTVGVLEPDMLFAKQPIVPNDECNDILGNVHPEYHICAGGVIGQIKNVIIYSKKYQKCIFIFRC